MTKQLPIILLLSILFSSCEKFEIPEDYPSIYQKLQSSRLSQMRTSLAMQNPYLVTSVNDFGFCDYLDDLLDVDTPPLQPSISQSEAIEITKYFISQHPIETGVKNSEDISFYKISTDTGYGGAIGWHFKTTNQKADTIEVMYSMILIHLTNGVVTSCYGNWYPYIFIPSHFNISQNKAKADLIGKTLSHYTIGGSEYYVTIKKADLDKSSIGLKILPIENEDIIELRVCWKINIPQPVYYEIYIDVMTGKIISQIPTIVS
jgi:Zn-dependent metalloprotease